jgi:hypothetical protein
MEGKKSGKSLLKTLNLTFMIAWKTHIQGVLRLVDITAGGDFLGLCDKKVNINMCPILDSYGVNGHV